MPDTFRTIGGRTIFWRDRHSIVHACEGSDVHRDVRLVWTLCNRDVPANAAYTTDGPEFATCTKCAQRERATIPKESDNASGVTTKSDVEREMEKATGPRENPSHPMFRDHNCAYCKSGEKPCRYGNPSACGYPYARND